LAALLGELGVTTALLAPHARRGGGGAASAAATVRHGIGSFLRGEIGSFWPRPVWWHRAGASCCLGWWPPPPLQRSQGSGRRRGSLVVLPRREDRAPRKGHRRAPVLRPLPGRSRQCGAGLLSGGRLLLLLSALDTHAATSLAPATPSRA